MHSILMVVGLSLKSLAAKDSEQLFLFVGSESKAAIRKETYQAYRGKQGRL
jgi:hypothetical protein